MKIKEGKEKVFGKEKFFKISFHIFRSSVAHTLQANENGIIQLGPLKNVETLSISNKNWAIGEGTNYSYPRTIHADAGAPLRIPYMDK